MEHGPTAGPRVLVVEDDPVVCRLIERSLLRHTTLVHTARDAASAVAALRSGEYDAVAIDISLPDASGHGVIAEARRLHPSAGIVAVTGHVGVDTAVTSMKAGSDDFLPKPFESEVLWHMLNKATETRRQRIAAERAESYRQLAYTDALTGIPNRRYVDEQLERVVAAAVASGGPAVVGFFDLDNLKLINDVYGHGDGDHMLREVARALGRVAGPDVVVGRYGGDEFVLVFQGMTWADASQVAERARRAVAALAPAPGQVRVVPVRVSVGLASWEPGMTAREVVARAESAMYTDKSVAAAPESAAAATSGTGQALEHTRMRVLRNLVKAVDRRDAYTRFHSDHATRLALRTGRQLGLDDAALAPIVVGGPIHDLGKIVVPDEILRKPGPLTLEERLSMEEHPVFGAAIAAAVTDADGVVDLIRHHHERFDGDGYPAGLRREEIPFLVRLFSLADAYSALVTDRPYRRGVSAEEAVAELELGFGSQFDPDVGRVFLEVVRAEEARRTRVA